MTPPARQLHPYLWLWAGAFRGGRFTNIEGAAWFPNSPRLRYGIPYRSYEHSYQPRTFYVY